MVRTNRRRRPRRNVKGRKLNPKQVKQVKDLIIRPKEVKYLVSSGATLVATSTTPVVMTATPQDLTDTGRIGDSIELKSCECKITITRNVLDTIINRPVRLVIFQWRPNTTNVAPTAGQMFLNEPVAGGVNWLSFYIKDNREQFNIVYDKTFLLRGNATTPTDTYSLFHQFHLPMNKVRKTVQFTGGGILGENHLYWFVLGNSDANQPTMFLTNRINYTDA